MKYLHNKSILSSLLKSITFLFLILLCCSVSNFSQEKTDYINLNYIIEKLTFTPQIRVSNEELNTNLIEEIKKRKVDFILTAKDEKSIKEAQGSDSLIKAIRENLPKSVAEKLKFYNEFDSLYIKFLSNRKGPELSKYEIAIKTGKELIKWYEDDERIKEQFRKEFRERFKLIIEYVRKQLKRIKAALECYL